MFERFSAACNIRLIKKGGLGDTEVLMTVVPFSYPAGASTSSRHSAPVRMQTRGAAYCSRT